MLSTQTCENSTPDDFVLERRTGPVFVRVDGPPERTAVVMTHGFTMDHRVFSAQVACLQDRYRVVTWDVHGHGRSGPLHDGFTLRRAAEDLLAVLDRIGIDRAVFVGHSMGGLISQEIEFNHPDRVLGLAMISSTCLTFRQPPVMGFGQPLTSAALQLWPDSWTHSQIGWIAGTARSTRAYASDASSRMSKADRVAVWRAILGGFHEEPDHRIRCPMLLLEGQWDWIVAAGLIKLLSGRWVERDRPWKHAVVPGAGHNAQQDNPAFCNRQLLAFLRHVEQRPGQRS